MSQNPFGDIPLFRELQRLLSSGTGPVNLEIAGQVANAIASEAGGDPRPSPELVAAHQRAVISAQQLLSGYTRLWVPEPPQAEVISRNAWIETTLKGWQWLMEDFAERFTSMLEGQAPEQAQGMEAMMGQIVPLMMGLQAGALVGHLSTEALFRYELPVPRNDDGKLFLVWPNAESVISAYGFDRGDLISWVALHDTGRHLILSSHPWVGNYFRSALGELVGSVEIDIGDIERRLMEIQTQGMEGLGDMTPEDTLPVVRTDRHDAALQRLRSFFAVFEGYASHSAGQVAPEVIPSASKIDEVMTRRAAAPSDGKKALTSVLGISLDRNLTAAGATFCAAVTKLRGIDELNRVWAAPDNLPSVDEIKDPFTWMERVLDA